MQGLQQTFYIIAIVYMVVQIIFWLGVGAILFALYRRIAQLSDNVEIKIGQVHEALSHPGDLAAQAGASLFQSIMQKLTHARK